MAEAESDDEREGTLHDLEEWLEKPMLVLGAGWLALLVLELTRGIGRTLQLVGTAIWVVFILDFLLRLTLAPNKGRYIRENWLTVVSLIVPALRTLRLFRVVRLLRAARATRGVRLVRVIGSLNRGMRSLGTAMSRRGFGYVLALTVIVTLVGAAGMYAFEAETPDGALQDYGSALWWTAMIMTTMGSEYWPRSPEGRMLCLVLALYAFAVFGYVTATLATFFVGQDIKHAPASTEATSLEAIRAELRALRAQVEAAPRIKPPVDPPSPE